MEQQNSGAIGELFERRVISLQMQDARQKWIDQKRISENLKQPGARGRSCESTDQIIDNVQHRMVSQT